MIECFQARYVLVIYTPSSAYSFKLSLDPCISPRQFIVRLRIILRIILHFNDNKASSS